MSDEFLDYLEDMLDAIGKAAILLTDNASSYWMASLYLTSP